jgi:MGT family glycosyltransferase
MSRFLITLSAGGGNVPPTLSVARALLERGHDVRVLTDPVLEPEVGAIGAEFVSWTTAPHRHDLDPSTDLAKDWEAKTPMGALARSRDGYFCGPAQAFADDVRAELERRPADAAAGEMLTFTTMIGAQGLGVPNAIISSTIVAREGWGAPPFGPGLAPAKGAAGRLRDRLIHAMSDRMWNKGLEQVNGARRAHGLPPLEQTLDQLSGCCDQFLLLTTNALMYPGWSPPGHVHVTGPRLEDPVWTEPVSLPPGDEPLVLVGLSSTFMDHSDAIARIAQALGALPVRGLITTGPAIDPASIDAPPNVMVVRSAPHSEVLRHAAVMVTHAGHGSVVKALGAGVPMVTMPLGRDQLDVAARAAWAGAAVRVSPKAKPGKIADAVRAILDDPSYTEAAARAAETIAAERAHDAAADALEELAGAPRSNGAAGASASSFDAMTASPISA